MFTPKVDPGTILVSFSDRHLYYVLPNNRAIRYPIGAPMGEARWSGVTVVSEKRINPVWTPTPDMRRENPTLPAYVPGGHPLNPLGVRAMYLGNSTYRIHGTDAPWTVGQRSPMAASACTTRTSSTSISACGSAPASSSPGRATLRDCALGGSTLILLFGTLLFVASLGPARPFLSDRGRPWR